MARYPFGRGAGRLARNPNLTYIIGGILMAAVVAVLFYGLRPFGANRGENTDEIVEASPEIPAESKAEEPATRLAAEVKPKLDLTDTISKPAPPPDTKVAELIAEAMAAFNANPNAVIDTRDRLNDLLPMPMSQQQRALIKDQLSKLADRWLFSRTVFPQDRLCETYKVQRGEQLLRIGERFKVPYEILMQINSIHRPQALQAGQTIKVIHGPFCAKIYRSTFTMDLYLLNTFVGSFPVGLGTPDRQTPTGTWRVKSGGRLVSPPWTDPDTQRVYYAGHPDYPLGSRWIELEGVEGEAVGQTSFGIHGTKEPNTIGTVGSRGCIRLHNGDAIKVYNLLVPIHSTVTVEE